MLIFPSVIGYWDPLFSLMVGLVSKIYNPSCSSCKAHEEWFSEKEYASCTCDRHRSSRGHSVDANCSRWSRYGASFADNVLRGYKWGRAILRGPLLQFHE